MNVYGTGKSNYGFANEWTDSYIKLIYLRSRYYAPATGRFLTKDVWQGDYTRPLSLNKWMYVEGNPVNYTDPSGQIRIKIWLSAFIEPPEIEFPYPYKVKTPSLFGTPRYAIDEDAKWNGNNRLFYQYGDSKLNSKMWHEVVFDTENLSAITTSQGTGPTVVKYFDASQGSHFTVYGHAEDPSPITYTVRSGKLEFHANGSVANPLIAVAPTIDYDYSFEFDFMLGKVEIRGHHDVFPWHEAYLEIGGTGYSIVKTPPSGPTKTPFDLALPGIPVSKTIFATELKIDNSCNDFDLLY